jgi:peptidyl-prolyl cis-trans isomerase A (cyclophilin A)/peptidyl-prolyl cis-trans isomerase B (cyclophilin B)
MRLSIRSLFHFASRSAASQPITVSALRIFFHQFARSHSMLRRSFLVTALWALSSLALSAFAAGKPQVEFDTTAGKIKVELYPEAAPKTVENFIEYVKAKHYDGTQFHRVIAGFMIQGGGYGEDFKEKPTRAPVPIESEQSSKAGLLNVPGTIAMARTPSPNSAKSQFFINVADNQALNFRSPDPGGYGYTVFGKVIEGMDVVNKIAKAPTGAGGPFPKDVPTEKVIIKSATLIEAK